MKFTFALALIFAVYGVVVLAAPAPAPVAEPVPDPFAVADFLARVGDSVLDTLDNTEWGQEAKEKCLKGLFKFFEKAMEWTEQAYIDTKKWGKQAHKDTIDFLG